MPGDPRLGGCPFAIGHRFAVRDRNERRKDQAFSLLMRRGRRFGWQLGQKNVLRWACTIRSMGILPDTWGTTDAGFHIDAMVVLVRAVAIECVPIGAVGQRRTLVANGRQQDAPHRTVECRQARRVADRPFADGCEPHGAFPTHRDCRFRRSPADRARRP